MSKRVNGKKGNRAKRKNAYGHPRKVRGGSNEEEAQGGIHCASYSSGKIKRLLEA